MRQSDRWLLGDASWAVALAVAELTTNAVVHAMTPFSLELIKSEDEIQAYLVSRFGEEILLTPSSSGVTGLVWVLPVVALALGAAGLFLAFRRWQQRPSVAASDEDRRRVAEARAEGP